MEWNGMEWNDDECNDGRKHYGSKVKFWDTRTHPPTLGRDSLLIPPSF
jgi:hypothetical protein